MGLEMSKKISIISPVFNEGPALEKFYFEVKNSLLECEGVFEFDFVFIDDGSADDSLEVLVNLVKLDKSVSVIQFSRNFGKEAATTAGLRYVKDSDAVIVMDSDLEHPPSVIPDMIAQWLAGAEVVTTRRRYWQNQSLFRRVGSKIFNKIMRQSSEVPMQPYTTDFRLYSVRILKNFQEVGGEIALVRATFDWFGYKAAVVDFDAPQRHVARSRFSSRQLFVLAIKSLMAFSLWPLRATAYLGGLVVFFSGCVLLWMLVTGWILEVTIYTPMAIFMVFNTFLIGILLGALGLMALYIGSIHSKVSGRPQFVISRIISSEPRDH